MLYTKLFIVMGIFWIFECIHHLVHGDHKNIKCVTSTELVFRIIGCINLLRGCLIFFIFVCKTSILDKVPNRISLWIITLFTRLESWQYLEWSCLSWGGRIFPPLPAQSAREPTSTMCPLSSGTNLMSTQEQIVIITFHHSCNQYSTFFLLFWVLYALLCVNNIDKIKVIITDQ